MFFPHSQGKHDETDLIVFGAHYKKTCCRRQNAQKWKAAGRGRPSIRWIDSIKPWVCKIYAITEHFGDHLFVGLSKRKAIWWHKTTFFLSVKLADWTRNLFF